MGRYWARSLEDAGQRFWWMQVRRWVDAWLRVRWMQDQELGGCRLEVGWMQVRSWVDAWLRARWMRDQELSGCRAKSWVNANAWLRACQMQDQELGGYRFGVDQIQGQQLGGWRAKSWVDGGLRVVDVGQKLHGCRANSGWIQVRSWVDTGLRDGHVWLGV